MDRGEWLLLDSGSMVHACGLDVATDLPVKPSRQTTLQSVDGSGISPYGQKEICVTLGNTDKVDASICFDVANVAYPVLSLGKILHARTQLIMSGTSGYLIRGNRRANVEVRNNVLMVQARRRPSPTVQKGIVAPLTSVPTVKKQSCPTMAPLMNPVAKIPDEQFDRMSRC